MRKEKGIGRINRAICVGCGGTEIERDRLQSDRPLYIIMRARNHLRTLKRTIGVVVSTSMDRTAVVAVPRLQIHPKTRRYIKLVTRFFCHDHHEVCGLGDKVQIQYCGQVSKKKHWTVIDMLERHPQLEGEPFPMSKLREAPVVAADGGMLR
jgi:small subunit ribosomal protein S17